MSAVAPSPVTPSPIPNPGSYASADVMAHNAYNNALAQINQNRLNTLTQYGYTSKINPKTGVLGNVQVDTHALHGGLQDLLHNQAEEDMQAAGAGQNRGLMGGLAHQPGTELRWQHASQDTALSTALENALSGDQTQQQQATETKNEALWQAQQTATDQANLAQQTETIDQLISGLGNPASVSGSKQRARSRVLSNPNQGAKHARRRR